MAVLTLGDVMGQCRDIMGGRADDVVLTRALMAAVNTVHTRVQLDAMAMKLDWMHQRDIIIPYTSTTTSVILPDGVSVVDSLGNIPIACHIVARVSLSGTGVALTHRARTLVEMEIGGLVQRGRGVPQFWDQSGVNSVGQRLLWIMPYPASAGDVVLDYYGGIRPLTSPTQALAVPVDFREIVCQRAIAKVMSTSSIDPVIRAEAKEEAAYMWRSIVAASLGGSPEFQGMAMIKGQTN